MKAKSFGKNLVPEKWTKMLLVNQNYRIFEPTISLEQNDEKPDFLHVDTDSCKKEGS